MIPLVLAGVAFADPDLHPIAQVRPRLEARTWPMKRPEGGHFIVEQRTRLGLRAEEGAISARAVVQDVRFWGEETDTKDDFSAGGLDLHEGWARWQPSDAGFIQLGRQEIVVHEDRLVGAAPWAASARSFDAARFYGKTHDFTADAIAGLYGLTVTTGEPARYDGIGVLRAGFDPKDGAIDGLAVVQVRPAADLRRVTAGVYARGRKGSFFGRVEGYWQATDTAGAARTANLAGVRVGFGPDTDLAPRVALIADRLSAGFDTLYGTNHKFYGVSDLFDPAGGATKDGLVDVGIEAGLGKADARSLELQVHGFADADGDWLGEEASLVAGAALHPRLRASGGFAAVLHDRRADAWGFVQLDAHFD